MDLIFEHVYYGIFDIIDAHFKTINHHTSPKWSSTKYGKQWYLLEWRCGRNYNKILGRPPYISKSLESSRNYEISLQFKSPALKWERKWEQKWELSMKTKKNSL